MADLNGAFDSNDYEPNVPFELIPAGTYVMRIVGSEIKQAKSDASASYLKFEMEMDENHHPDMAGRKVWDNLNLWNANAKTVQIANATLSAICRAAGKPIIRDTEELHGSVLLVKISVKPAEGQFEAQNRVRGYLPLDGGTTAAAPAAQAAKTTGAPAKAAWQR